MFTRPELSREEYLWDAQLLGRLLALSANISMGWKGLPGTNTSLLRTFVNDAHNIGQGSLTDGGRLSVVDLLVLTSLDKILFMLKILFNYLKNKLP
jgi:hypothetical protein